MAYTQRVYLDSTEKVDLFTITYDVKRAVADAAVKQGLVSVTLPLSDAGVTLLENDPAIHEALRDFLLKLIPDSTGSRPVRRSKTGFVHAHLRAFCVGPTLALPIIDGALGIGPWQDIVVYDFDNRVARRECVIHIVGDSDSKGKAAPTAAGRRPAAAGKTLPPGKATAV